MMKGTRKVLAGTGHVHAHPMEPSCSLDSQVLRKQLQRDGYLLLKGFLSASNVSQAQQVIVDELKQWKPSAFEEGARNVGLMDRQDLASSPPLLRVLEHRKLFRLMSNLLGAEVVTAGFKWLRAVGHMEFTGAHMDRVFVGGSARMLTAWIPLGDVPVEHGSLLVCRGSHRTRAFSRVRGSYGSTAVGRDGTASGWLTDDGARVGALVGSPAAVDWRTADLRAGDVVVLDADVLHMSAANVSGWLRLSCDTRWQLAREPRDPRLRVWRAQRQAEELLAAGGE